MVCTFEIWCRISSPAFWQMTHSFKTNIDMNHIKNKLNIGIVYKSGFYKNNCYKEELQNIACISKVIQE